MPLLENLRIAFHAIKGQMLRTVLTVLIIAIGIMALVGILTAIEGLKASINTNFTSMSQYFYHPQFRAWNTNWQLRKKI